MFPIACIEEFCGAGGLSRPTEIRTTGRVCKLTSDDIAADAVSIQLRVDTPVVTAQERQHFLRLFVAADPRIFFHKKIRVEANRGATCRESVLSGDGVTAYAVSVHRSVSALVVDFTCHYGIISEAAAVSHLVGTAVTEFITVFVAPAVLIYRVGTARTFAG